MKTRVVWMDFGQEIFGKAPCQQVRTGDVSPSGATDAQQIPDSDERTGAMPGKVKGEPTEE